MRRNRIKYIALLLLSINFIYFYGGIVPYSLFYTAISLAVFSFLYAYFVYRKFSCSIYLEKIRAVKGEKVFFEYIFFNKAFLMNPYIKGKFCDMHLLTEKLNEKEASGFSLEPFATFRKGYGLDCRYTGIYTVGIENLYIEDLLGIFRFRANAGKTYELLVYPKIIEIQNIPFIARMVNESEITNRNTWDHTNEVSDVRQYIMGDSLKKIHWKHTAKMNEIMVKNFESTTKNTTEILLDLSPVCLEDEAMAALKDKFIEMLIAVSNYFAVRRQSVRIRSFSENFEQIEFEDEHSFSRLYYSSIRIQFHAAACGTLPEITNLFFESGDNGMNLFIFTCDIREKNRKEILRAMLRGYCVTVFYLNPGHNIDKNSICELRSAGINVVEYFADSDIKRVIEDEEYMVS